MPSELGALPRLRVPRLALPPKAGDDWAEGSAWRGAASVAPFTLADGSAPAAQATEARLAWDDQGLYVRFQCADRDAWGTLLRRNDPVYAEEAVEIFLAPGPAAPRRYLEIEISPLGTVFAASIHHPTGRRSDLVADTSWPCHGLRSQVGRGAARQDWWAALAIPWHALLDGLAAAAPASGATAGANPQPPEDAADAAATATALPAIWRANLYRIERPRDAAAELSCWSPTLTRPPDFHKPERFGLLELVGAQPPRQPH